MNNIEILQKYDFHDSLLEKCTYDKTNKTVNLEIDLCFWKQTWYEESLPETGMITLVFHNVAHEVSTELALNSDEIVSFEFMERRTGIQGVKFVVYNDKNDEAHCIEIQSQTVSIQVKN